MIAIQTQFVTEVHVSGIDFRDMPDFVDAFIDEATYHGRPMTDEELDALNEDSMFVHEAVQKQLY